MPYVVTSLVGLMVLLVASGCTGATSRRGVVEFGRMRVATDVKVVPRPVEAPSVSYPEVLLAQSMEGTAEISFVVSTNGVPGDIRVIAASDPAFGEAAVAAVKRLRYVPAQVDGMRVPCKVEQTFFFRIH